MRSTPQIKIFLSSQDLYELARDRIASCIDGRLTERSISFESCWHNAQSFEERMELFGMVDPDGITVTIDLGERDTRNGSDD